MNRTLKDRHIQMREARWLLRDKYEGKETDEYFLDVKRLQKGEPLDYVIGHVPFLDTSIDLLQKPLIPRGETEYWIEIAIKEMKRTKKKQVRALDIFAGSGCIGVAVLKSIPDMRVDFADIDSNMIEQIKINVKRNDVASRARVIRSDGFQNMKGRYDYIFANPPYVNAKDMQKLSYSVKDFEPERALFGGKDGLFFIKKFLLEVPKFLKKGGMWYMEFGSLQKRAVEKLIQKKWREIEFLKDQYGRWRVVRVVK